MTEPEIGSLADESAVRSMQLGEVRLTYVVDGSMALTSAGFFPGIPAEYFAEHLDQFDEHGRAIMSAGGLLVERDGQLLLIDAGFGEVVGEVSIGPISIGVANSGALPETLAALGHAPEDITAVAFTHLHVDHTGWAFVPDGSGGHRPFFPNARYFIAEPEWAPHGRGETIPGASPRTAIIEPMGKRQTLIADGAEFLPGVRALVTPGHSPGHTSYIISTSAGRLIAFGDAFHIPAQLTHPDWPSKPDVDAAAVIAARGRLIAELTEPDTLGFGIHFGDQAFGRVELDSDGLAHWVPVPATTLLPAPRTL